MILYGKQVFFYILEKHPKIIKELHLSKEIDTSVFKKISSKIGNIKRVDNMKAQAMAKGGNHQGFIFEIDDFLPSGIDEIKTKNKIVILVGVTDMGNIGAIARSAYCLGYDALIVTEVADLKFENIIRASSGAALEMPICSYKKTLDLSNELKQVGFYCVASGMQGDDLHNVDLTGKDKIALFLGSEGEGIPQKVINKMDKVVSIKMDRDFDSLNVSVAAGILMDRMR